MANVEFGLVVPTGALDKSRRSHYLDDANRLLNAVKGAYASAWLVDHLQFHESDVLEGWTALTIWPRCILNNSGGIWWGHSGPKCCEWRRGTLTGGMYRQPALRIIGCI